MQVNNQIAVMNNSMAFRGRVDSTVIKKIEKMEKDLICNYVDRVNHQGKKVDPKVIIEIKERFQTVIASLKAKAEELFKDSVITVNSRDSFVVKHEKLNEYSHLLRQHIDHGNNYFGKHKNILDDALYNGDQILRSQYRYTSYIDSDFHNRIYYAQPKSLSELEVITELFNPEPVDRGIVKDAKERLLDSINYNKDSKFGFRLKRQAKKILDVEKEITPKNRELNLLKNVKEALNNNARQKALEKVNNKCLP